MGINDEYKKISQRGNIITKYPVAYFPRITDDDYTLGYIIRYFVKLKTNKDSSIIEVDESEYKKYSSEFFSLSSLFQFVSLRWRIIGKRDDVIMGNTKTVESRELLMPGISIRLGNRLQFWKDL